MTKIEMLETKPVSVNGITVEIWSKGSQHEVDDDLLKSLIQCGSIALVEDISISEAPENKAHKVRRKKRTPKK
tara:strand:- start:2815 stop:3033 length:219 start_codon:yes stop_codon:yes gene_type:complete